MTGPAGPGPGRPPVTLASLAFGWGDAYDLGYRDDQWIAARRDGRGVLAASTLSGLDAAIEADYRNRPVPRDFDPPRPVSHDTGPGDQLGEDESFLLSALRAAFPAWAIDYSTGLRAWTASSSAGTLCVNSPVLLCAVLVLIERRHRTRQDLP
jgi:hypothetical protein